MRLIACTNCHAQYDIADLDVESFPCRCGTTLENRVHEAVDARVERCGSCGALVPSEADSCGYCGSLITRDDASLSLICPECYARCADDARFCTACGVGFRPEKMPENGRELPCPVCTKLMPPRMVGGFGLNECLECRGLWVPGDHFDQLVARAIEARRNLGSQQLATLDPRLRGANPAAQRVQYRKCPECDAFMNRRNYRKCSGVIIDDCNHCGTWLDADELEAIAGFILSGDAERPLAENLQPDPIRTRLASTELARIAADHGHDPPTARSGGFTSHSLVDSVVDVLLGLFR